MRLPRIEATLRFITDSWRISINRKGHEKKKTRVKMFEFQEGGGTVHLDALDQQITLWRQVICLAQPQMWLRRAEE